MTQENKRELLPDVLRGFAIILVVFAHCIQEGSGGVFEFNALYFSDRVYQFIYSFHMPLFMLISGYLAWNSLRKPSSSGEKCALLWRRSISLQIPIWVYTLLQAVYLRISGGAPYGTNTTAQDRIVSFLIKGLGNLWFLWAVFWCFLLVWVVHYLLRDAWWIYGLLFIALFVTPDGLGLGAYKYMLPYYLIGFYGHRALTQESDVKDASCGQRLSEMVNHMQISQGFGFAACTILLGLLWFLGTWFFFTEDSFIYLTGYKLLGKDIGRQLFIDGYRFVIGLVGCGFWMLFFRGLTGRLPRKAFAPLIVLGRDSMGIYILSGIVILLGVAPIAWEWEPSYAVNAIETILTLLICVGLTEVLARIPILRHLVGK